MRVAKRHSLSVGVPLVAALTLVFLSAPLAVYADETCTNMTPSMQTGYRAVERGQYAEADNAFGVAENQYATCLMATGAGVLAPDNGRWATYWMGYAKAGRAAAMFGSGKITDGLKSAKNAEDFFDVVVNGKGMGEGASDSLRRAASDGVAYVHSLVSAKKPLLPKVWLDWKVAHPSG